MDPRLCRLSPRGWEGRRLPRLGGLAPRGRARFPGCEPLEERGNDLESARLAAIRGLLMAPAPDLHSLALKVALAVDEEIAFFSGGELCLASVKADALRLCNGG